MKTWLEVAKRGELGLGTSFKDREIICSFGEPLKHVWLFTEGAWEIFQTNADGRSVVVKLMRAPSILGSVELVAGEPLWLENARAIGKVRGFRLPAALYFNVLRLYSRAALESMGDIAQCFASAAKFESSRLYEAEALLATLLLGYAEVAGVAEGAATRLTISRSQAELASSIGASERQVHRIFIAWKAQGVVTKSAGKLTIQKRDVLRKVAGDLKDTLVHQFRAPAWL